MKESDCSSRERSRDLGEVPRLGELSARSRLSQRVAARSKLRRLLLSVEVHEPERIPERDVRRISR
jgi:hypothetical protein